VKEKENGGDERTLIKGGLGLHFTWGGKCRGKVYLRAGINLILPGKEEN